MILVNRDAPPEMSIFYVSCVIIELMNGKNKKVDNLHLELEKKLGSSLHYNTLLLSLSFLFLANKIEFSEGKIKCT